MNALRESAPRPTPHVRNPSSCGSDEHRTNALARKRATHRLIARLALFLLLGAIVNVGVAWFCAINLPFAVNDDVFVEAVLNRSSRSEPKCIDVGRVNALGCCQLEVWSVLGPMATYKHSDGMLHAQFDGMSESFPITVSQPLVSARWSRIGVWSVNARRIVVEGETAAGWPMYCLWGCLLQYEHDTKDYADEPIATLYIGETAISGAGLFGSAQRLPLQPIWPGFAINTLLYATTLWLVFIAPFTLRRWNRTRRGLCGACAYPIGTSSVCTECGAVVRSRADGVRVGRSEPQRAAHRDE